LAGETFIFGGQTPISLLKSYLLWLIHSFSWSTFVSWGTLLLLKPRVFAQTSMVFAGQTPLLRR
jgi:hypothetical protein